MRIATWTYVTVQGTSIPFELRAGKKGTGAYIGSTWEGPFVEQQTPMHERCAQLEARAKSRGYTILTQ